MTVVDLKGNEYRELPNNLPCEQALLGAILICNEGLDKISFLKAEHFFEPVHGRIFSAIKTLADRGEAADPIKLKPYFEDDEALKDVGGFKYIVRLASSAPTIFNPEDYAQPVYDLAVRRRLIELGEEMISTAYDSPIDLTAKDQIEHIEQELFRVSDLNTRSGAVSFAQALKESMDGITTARNSPEGLSGVTTGLRGIDKYTAGLHKTDLIILAGRPAMGKTALATNIGFSAAKKYLEDEKTGATVGFFSLEMSRDQLSNRILAERTGVSAERMRRGDVNTTEFEEIKKARQELDSIPLFIDDTPCQNIASLRSSARRLVRANKIGLIVVDYLQLMLGVRGETRSLELSGITRGLKNLAKELKLPILAISQLSRQTENRPNKRPQLSDLRESGTIEEHADIVMFVYRSEYYLDNVKPDDPHSKEYAKWSEKMRNLKGKAEIIFSKNRHGKTGKIDLGFKAETTKFYDL